MADRDVRLIIRAKNEATKEIKSVSDAMSVLAKETSDAAKDLKKPVGVMAQLGQEFKRLNSQIKVSEALGKVSDYMKKAAGGVADLKDELNTLKSSFEKSSAATAAFDARVSEIRQNLESLRKTQQQQRADQKEAIALTNRESEASKKLSAAKKELTNATALSDKNPERESRVALATQNVAGAQAAYDAQTAAADEMRAKVKATAAEIAILEAALKENEKALRTSQSETTKFGAAVESVAGQLERGEAALAEITTEANTFRAALGATGKESSELASQLRAVTPEAEKLGNTLAALKRYSTGNEGFFRTPNVAASMRSQREEMERSAEAQRELTKIAADLARQIKASGDPTGELAEQFREVTAAARAAKTTVNESEAAIGKLQGTTRRTFDEFSKLNGVLPSVNGNYQRNTEAAKALADAMGRYSTGNGGVADAKIAANLREQGAAVDQARSRWQTLTAEVQRLNGVYASSGGEQIAAELRQVATAANLAEKEFREAAAALKQMETAGNRGGGMFAGINASGRESLSLYQRLRGEVLSLTAAFVGFYGAIQNIGGVINAYRTMEAAQNRLGAVFAQNQQLVANELNFVERQAARLGIEFGTLSDQYSKFAVSAQAANISGEDTRKIFLSIAEAGRVNKLSLEDMNGIFLAVTQMIQKGRVSSEELRQQLGERLPGAVNIFADALGVTTEELSKMLEQGEVLANSDTLLKFADQLNKRFGPQLAAALQSTSTEIGKFQNNIYNAQLQFAKGGFIESFTEGLRGLNQWFQSTDGREFFLGLGSAAGKVVDVLALIPPNIDTIMMVVKALIATKLAGWFLGVINGVSGLTKAQIAMINSNKALSASIAGLTATLNPAAAATATLGAATTTTATKMTLATSASAAMTAGVGVLRGAMALAATGARALWAAIGGWAGIIVSAVAYLASDLIGSWLTQVDDVTTTLSEHEALMGRILTAYDEAAGKTDKWGAALAKVNLDELDTQSRTIQSQLDELRNKMKTVEDGGTLSGVTTAFRGLFGGWDDVIVDVDKLTRAYKNGEKGVKDYVAELEKLYGTLDDDAAKEYVAGFLKDARAADELTTALERTRDAADKKRQTMDGLRGSIDAMPSPLEKMANATKGAEQAFDDGKMKAEEYKTALENIKEFIPELAQEAKKLDEMTKLAANFANGLNSITPEMFRLGQMAVNAINEKYTNYEAQYTSQRGTPQGAEMERLVKATTILAEKMGVSAKDLLTVFSYETGGTLDPWKAGPTTQWGQHRGLIQWGEPQAQKYGVNANTSVEDQIMAAGKYLQDAGVKAGDGLLQIYAAINAGNAKNISASDANNGGAPGTVLDKVSNQMGGHQSRADALLKTYAGVVKDGETIVENEKKANEERKKGEEATQKRLADGQFELEQQKLKNDGKEREAAIAQAEREARAENKNITDQELAKVKELAAARYDAANALSKDEESKKRSKELTEAINGLETQRNALLEQRKVYEEKGDKEGLTRTDAELAGVNAKLTEAIDKSIAFHQALGGEKAAGTVAQLNATKLAIANANMEGQKFAMTATQMSDSIYQTLESGIIGMFDTFAQAIANGENAVDALWTAFRKFAADFLLQIAQMIIKQTLFNSLQSFSKSLGGGLFSFLSMHSGGVVGASGVGSGSRSISPAWFTNAVRYHTGGMVGLAPDEVPIVARQGEEVLTETDPRHRNNGGLGGGGGNTKVVNMFDAPSFLSEALNSKVGEEAIFNFVRANPAAFKQALNG